jgi:hypothetical protein
MSMVYGSGLLAIATRATAMALALGPVTEATMQKTKQIHVVEEPGRSRKDRRAARSSKKHRLSGLRP